MARNDDSNDVYSIFHVSNNNEVLSLKARTNLASYNSGLRFIKRMIKVNDSPELREHLLYTAKNSTLCSIEYKLGMLAALVPKTVSYDIPLDSQYGELISYEAVAEFEAVAYKEFRAQSGESFRFYQTVDGIWTVRKNGKIICSSGSLDVIVKFLRSNDLLPYMLVDQEGF